MQPEWIVLPLSAVAREITVGFVGTMADQYVDDGVPFLRSLNVRPMRIDTSDVKFISREFHQRLRKSALRPGDVVIVRTGKPGTCAVIPETLPEANCSDVVIVRCAHELRPEFLSYWVNAMAVAHVSAHTVGAVQQHFNVASAKLLRLPVPPLSVQDTVLAPLLALDRRIDLLRQTNATLESIAQALFKSWFIDFDPVRAKSEGREPEGMDAVTAALFPAEFEESALGLIPKGWRTSAIQDVVENVYDGPHATPPEATEGPVFLGIKNLTGTSVDLTDVRYIGEGDWARWTKRVTPQANDIVFSYEAALGLFALIPPGLRCCLGRRLALVRPKQVAGSPHFWFHQFIGAPFQRLLDKHTVQGATVNRIALKEFPSFTVMDPGEQLRAAFEAVSMPLWARIHANRQQALKLAELRDSLLPRLISGKLRLPEAQERAEEALP